MVFCCIEQTYEEEAESTLVEVIPSKTAAKTAANGSSGKIPSPLTFENTEKRKKFAGTHVGR